MREDETAHKLITQKETHSFRTGRAERGSGVTRARKPGPPRRSWHLGGAGALNMQSLEEVLPKAQTGTNALASPSLRLPVSC